MSRSALRFRSDSKILAKILVSEIFYKRNMLQKYRDQKGLEDAIESGSVLGPLQLEADEHGNAVFKIDAYYTRYRPGDTVTLNCLDGSELKPVDDGFTIKSVDFVGLGELEIKLSGRTISANPGEYYLTESANESISWLLWKRILEAGEKESQITKKPLKIITPDSSILKGLNEQQLKAIESALKENFNGAIQGPPGTGKTQVLSALIGTAIASGLRVGLTAFTHTAIDNALKRVMGIFPQLNCIRVGNNQKVSPEIGSLGAKIVSSFADIRSHQGISLVAATTHAWALSGSAPWVDVMLVDEAGQVPSFMMPCLNFKTNSLVCLGDHKQLPPVLPSVKPGMIVDLFSEVISQISNTTMLEEQFRMNKRLQEWSNKAYYDGRLRAAPQNEGRDVLASCKQFQNSDIVSLVTYSSSAHERKQAEIVLQEIEKARAAGLAINQIGVITPHRNQASAINQMIQETLGVSAIKELSADTVERYQGQERELVILGLSTIRDVPSFDSSCFVSNPNRLNVAATRARSRLSVVSNMSPDSGGINKHAEEFLQWAGSKTFSRFNSWGTARISTQRTSIEIALAPNEIKGFVSSCIEVLNEKFGSVFEEKVRAVSRSGASLGQFDLASGKYMIGIIFASNSSTIFSETARQIVLNSAWHVIVVGLEQVEKKDHSRMLLQIEKILKKVA
jgi:DNA replication ATP-dependent helicase Dna2